MTRFNDLFKYIYEEQKKFLKFQISNFLKK